MPQLDSHFASTTVNCESRSVEGDVGRRVVTRAGFSASGGNKKQGHGGARVRRCVNGIPIFPVNAPTSRCSVTLSLSLLAVSKRQV